MKETQIDKVRQFIRENPTASNETIGIQTGVQVSNIKVYISRDLKEGRLEQYQVSDKSTDEKEVRFLDYGDFMTEKEVLRDAKDYKKTVHRKMAQMIYEAAEKGDNVENLVMASREIRNALERISK